MSEEILRALMEMFALIVKQDGGMLQSEKDFVADFLTKQLPHKSADEFMSLFIENAGPVQEKGFKSINETPSVKDSVKILNICKKINKTLTQEQKVIVLVRVFELIDSDKQYTPQRMNIVNTIAEVFRVSQDEFNLIMAFVSCEERKCFDSPSMLVINNEIVSSDDTYTVFLKVSSVNLYFFRSFGHAVTYLSGMPVRSRKVYTFAQGSSLTTPPLPALYYGDVISRFFSEEGVHRLTFVAEHLMYRFPDGIPAVRDVSFSASEGQLIGIMGASGTGKTTLLNLLCGLVKPLSGDVRINSLSVYPAGRAMDGVIGLVPQDDLLMEDLTVFENLFYAASLCFSGKTREELTAVVNQMLQTLGLFGKRNHRVGSPLNKVISGGQRKRLNIALELIREPSVLFLDEPTSGLSSRDSENIISLLHELTLRGKLVITVIHQPSSEIFKGFDKVLILDEEGEEAFYGNPIEAVVHFKTLDTQINSDIGECPTCGNVNPETLFNILETRVIDEFGRYTDRRKVSPQEWAELYRTHYPFSLPEEEKQPAHSNLSRPGWMRQLMIFLTRDIRSKIADRQYMLLTLLEGPILGLILSYIIRYIANPLSDIYIFRENENIPIYIFMSIIVALFLGLTISAEEIFRDRKMLKREHFLHLRKSSYLMAKVSLMMAISALQSFLFLVIANPILGIKGLFFSYWLALFATSFSANMVGLNISSAFRSAIAIYIVIPLLMIPMMVLSGAMFPFDKLNRSIGNVDKVPVIAELMPTRWTYEALMVKQFKGNEYDKRVYPLKQQISISDFNTIYRIPRVSQEVETAMEHLRWEGRILQSDNHFSLITNEVKVIESKNLLSPFPGIDSLTIRSFSIPEGEKLLAWLESARREFTRQSNAADLELDKYISNNKETLNNLYNSYHNDKLEEIIRKLYEKNKILEYRDHFIQNVDLVYLEPQPSGPLSFRTHFMAPVKKFAGFTIDTFAFNIILVLLSTVILYLLLYFDILKVVVESFDNIKPQKR